MKKFLCYLMILGVLFLSACGETVTDSATPDVDVTDATDTVRDPFPKIDMDLSSMNSAMVYPTVLEMFGRMESYKGQVVKMTGKFSAVLKDGFDEDDPAPEYYYQCVVQDVTACCLSGLEFVLAGDPSYPDGYPTDGSEITIVGRFEIYEEDEYIFPHLVDTVLLDCQPPQT